MSKGFEGPWRAVQLDEHGGHWWVVSTDPDGYRTVDESGDGGFEEGTASFIAEAGTVLHETGLTPRQLAEQRAELLEALSQIAALPAHPMRKKSVEIAEQAIANATQQRNATGGEG